MLAAELINKLIFKIYYRRIYVLFTYIIIRETMKGRQSLFKMSGNLYRMLVWDLVRTGGTLEVDMQEWKRICIQMDIFDAINPEEFLSSCTSIQYRSIDNSRFAMKLQLNFGYCPVLNFFVFFKVFR